MRGLTIHQPWTWLLATGQKQYETRSWQTHYRGRVAIHSSRTTKYISRAQRYFYSRGVILAVGDLTECVRTKERISEVSETEIEYGDWEEGRWAWKFENVVQLAVPIATHGQQGLWKVNMGDMALIEEDLNGQRTTQ